MKKNILMLINGFGVEQSGSYNVYSDKLMPVLDDLTKKGIFITIPNNFLDYKTAYRKFSMDIDYALTHTLINRNINTLEYVKNPLLVYIINELNKKGSNCHLFCYWDCPEVVHELTAYVREIEEKTKGKIFLHFILNQKSVHDYKYILDGLTKLTYEFGQRVKIGIISGEDNLSHLDTFKEFMKCFLTEAGEKWKDIEKKIEVFSQTKTKPYQARTFAVNYGFRIEENDQIIFFNYYSTNITNIRKELNEQKYRKFDTSTIGIYSLFPLECDIKIPFIYNYALASDYFSNNLKTANVKCLVLDTKEKCIQINYYLTGLRNEISDNLKYVSVTDDDLYDENKLLEIIKTHDKDLYIINYEIDSCRNVEELENKLNKIDKLLGIIRDYCTNNKIGLFISSLYGMEKEMYNAKAELCRISFYSKVPLIVFSEEIDLTTYSLNEGNMFDLANTLIFCCNKEYKNMGLLKKKSKLFSFLYKKPKNTTLKEKKITTIEDGKIVNVLSTEQAGSQKVPTNTQNTINNDIQTKQELKSENKNNLGSVNKNV
ncbi:MAG: hypothetical protein ACI33S_01500 [Bacilli bacterium]